MNKIFHYKNILAFLLLIFIFLISLKQISDFDIWFHLKTGQYIIENKTIPYTDPFSFTAGNNQWKLHDWFTTIIYYLSCKLFGFNAIIILNSLLIAITFLIVYKTALLYKKNDEENLIYYTSFFTIICAVLISRPRFVIRPFIFSYLFLSLLLYILRLYKTKEKNLLYLLPILMLFWCNMHYGYILGLFVLLTYSLGEILKWAGKLYFKYEPEYLLNSQKIKNIFIITILCIFTSLINPYGWHLPLYGLELHNVLLNFPIMEHMTTILKLLPLFTTFIVILFILFLLTINKTDFTEFLLILIFLYLCLSNLRFIPKFVIIASPILAQHLNFVLGKFINITRKKTVRTINIFSVIITTIILIPNIVKSGEFGFGIKKRAFPEKAVKFLKDNSIKGNMFNPYHFGGYLNWALFPQNRIFVDGRLVFFGPNILQKYNEIAGLHPLWEQLLSETGVDLVIFTEAPFLNNLRKTKAWSLIYWDELVSIYLRDLPANAKLIKKYEHKYINPNDKKLSYLDGKNNTQINKTINDIKKKISSDNKCSLAHLLLAVAYSKKNKFNEQLEEYLNAIKTDKRLALAWNNAGTCYSKMLKQKEAIKYFKKAIMLDPYMDEAYSNLGEIYHRNEKFQKAYRYYKKALIFNQNNYNAHNNLGSIFLSWKKFDDADMEFRKAIGINPSIPEAWYNIACLNALKGNLLGFMYYFKKALLVTEDKEKYIRMAQDELCFEKIKRKKIFTKLTCIPWPYGKSK